VLLLRYNRVPQIGKLKATKTKVTYTNNNNNWNLYSGFFMPNMIKCALQFDKVIKNK